MTDVGFRSMMVGAFFGLGRAAAIRGRLRRHNKRTTSLHAHIIRVEFVALLSLSGIAAVAQGVDISKAHAQDIAGLIQYAAESGSQVDRALHDRFWALIPDDVRRDPSAFFEGSTWLGKSRFKRSFGKVFASPPGQRASCGPPPTSRRRSELSQTTQRATKCGLAQTGCSLLPQRASLITVAPGTLC